MYIYFLCKYLLLLRQSPAAITRWMMHRDCTDKCAQVSMYKCELLSTVLRDEARLDYVAP